MLLAFFLPALAGLTACGGAATELEPPSLDDINGSDQSADPDSPTDANGAPFISMSPTGSVLEHDNEGIHFDVSDPDGDPLTVSIEQVSGPAVDYQVSDSMISFKVPTYAYGIEDLRFRVTATDPMDVTRSVEATRSILPNYANITQGSWSFTSRRADSFAEGEDAKLALSMETGGEFRAGVYSLDEELTLEIYDSELLEPESLIYTGSPGELYDGVVDISASAGDTWYVVIDSATSADFEFVLYPLDSRLQAGFPVGMPPNVFYNSGFAQSRLAIDVGNIDADTALEIVTSVPGSAPLYAFNGDGSRVAGWPAEPAAEPEMIYHALGNLAGDTAKLEVAFSVDYVHYDCNYPAFHAVDGAALPLPNWPVNDCDSNLETLPVVVDTDGDGSDEVFFNGYGFAADASPLAGWATADVTYSAADIDADGTVDFISAAGDEVAAINPDRSSLSGFPVTLDRGGLDATVSGSVVTGDVSGDTDKEIILMSATRFDNSTGALLDIVDSAGTQLLTVELASDVYDGKALALADLDGDGKAEIIIQTDTQVEVIAGDGSSLPGWPQTYMLEGTARYEHASPLVADVDGDLELDIVILSDDRLLVYSRTGELTTEIRIPRPDRMPAIADIDEDGRNEIIVGATLLSNDGSPREAIWVYDLGGPANGDIAWGQYGGGPRHQNTFPPVN